MTHIDLDWRNEQRRRRARELEAIAVLSWLREHGSTVVPDVSEHIGERELYQLSEAYARAPGPRW